MVPAHNYAHYIRSCLASVVSQVHVDVDVVVVNDGSTDDTAEVVGALAADDPRIRLIDREENRGLAATVNEGVAAVDGEFLVKLDADDLLSPGALARATALLQAEPSIGFVAGRPLHFTDQIPSGPGHHAPSWTIWSGREWIEAHCRSGYNSISNPEVVARRSVVDQTDGRDLAQPLDDFEMWLQLASRSDVGRIYGPAQAYYRVHADSMLRTTLASPTIDLRGRMQAFESTLGGDAEDRISGATELLGIARRTIAGQALDRACRAYERGRTQEVPVDELQELALEILPTAPLLPQWRALERRRRIGERRAPYVAPFVARAVARRAGDELRNRRWQRTGMR